MASGHNRERLHNNIDSFRTVQEPKTGPFEHFETARSRLHPHLFQ
jgi:hypothetical protein